MKRQIFLALLSLSLLCSQQSSAWTPAVQGMVGGGGAISGCANTCSGNYGNTWEDGTQSGIVINYMQVTKIALTGACSGSDPTLHAYLTDNATTNNFWFIVYDDNGVGGEPGTLLYTSTAISTVNGTQWFTHVSAISCLVSTNGSLWIGIISGGSVTPYYKAGGTPTRTVDNGSTNPPSTWPLDTDTHSANQRGFYLSW
jgi:hypothetical protein